MKVVSKWGLHVFLTENGSIHCGSFPPFILVGVYILPQSCVSEALQHLADQITNMERKHLDSLLIILGDFDRASLSHKLPNYRLHIKCLTL